MAAAAAAIIGLPAAGKRLRASSSRRIAPARKAATVLAKKEPPKERRRPEPGTTPPRAVKAEIGGGGCLSISTAECWRIDGEAAEIDGGSGTPGDVLVRQKSMLEKQWSLAHGPTARSDGPGVSREGSGGDIVPSGPSARERSKSGGRRHDETTVAVRPNLAGLSRLYCRLRGPTGIKRLLTNEEVAYLCAKVKVGLLLEDYRERLKVKLGLGCKPSDIKLASSLKISYANLTSKLDESSSAREILSKANIRLVVSIAKKYANFGVDMSDLVQGGLVGLQRGIEKFDPSRGFRFSTYVYWWIRQGISKALMEQPGTLGWSPYLKARIFSIRRAESKLKDRGITPSVDKIAEFLNISPQKVLNAKQADIKVLSLDGVPFASLDGQPSESLQNYAACDRPEDRPWIGFLRQSLKEEVHMLIDRTLQEREKRLILLYYGLESKQHTWEEVGKQVGLSRERVRILGNAAMDKLRDAARKRGLEAMLFHDFM